MNEVQLIKRIKNMNERLQLKEKALANYEQRLRNLKQGKGHSSYTHQYGKSRTGKRTYVRSKQQSNENVEIALKLAIKNRNEEIAEIKQSLKEANLKLRALKPTLDNTALSKLEDFKNKYKSFIASVLNK